MNDIIKNYCHDYRNMRMTEDELRDMLESFIKEVNESCQSKKLSQLYVTELPADGKWIISFGMPDFQQTDDVHSMEVDESTGIEILEIQSCIDTLPTKLQDKQ